MSHTSPYKPYLHTSNLAKTPHQNLFMSMSEIERSRDDQGIMNLGQNCTLCNQLDFLPFHCEFCNGTFCLAHRTLDVHKCVGRPQKAPQNPENSGLKSNLNSDSIANGETAASLFPDRAKHQKSLDALIEALGSAVAAKSKAKSTPLMKLTKFLHLQRLKRESQKKSVSLFGKKKTPAVSLTAEVAKIKKVAKGPAAVSAADRVYAWVLFVNRNESEFGDISEEKERKAVWVLKNWSVGRALDAIAETMNIMNHNNLTQQSEERLNLFKVEKESPVALVSSVKVGTGVPNGATLYLVKGTP